MTLPLEVPGRTPPFAIHRKPFLQPWEASAQLRLQAEEVGCHNYREALILENQITCVNS